jgi:hypothetical protein
MKSNRCLGGCCFNAIYYKGLYFRIKNKYTFEDPRIGYCPGMGLRVVRGIDE